MAVLRKDAVLEGLKTKFDHEKAQNLFNKYIKLLGDDYFTYYNNNDIIHDVEIMDGLSDNKQYAISLGSDVENNKNNTCTWRIKLFKLNDAVSLSRGLPIIENFGVKLFEEHPHKIKLDSGSTIYVCDFVVEVPQNLADKINDSILAKHLQEAIVAVFNRENENDSLNQLVLYSGLEARQVLLLRAITHYLVQTSLPFSGQYLADCLCEYPNIAHNLFLMFDAKFNVESHSLDHMALIKGAILADLNLVTSLDHDQILNGYLDVIEAMLRTNYYQANTDNKPKAYISFKLESKKIPFLPKPCPLYEVFVYSMRFEAIHLRGGRVARGGLRWSDRREDFRTEVLGLVKAQMVKNSVIVPTGSKGGFVCKKLPDPSERENYLAEGVQCYKTFIAGLLDITDNLVAGKTIHPQDVVIYDEADPYLVVAADKGTATFSDYANQMSQQYNFWLGDAFASGGSVGYDHKKMGITARGAWESAKRHFRHLGINIQTQDFTVIGIGDMAGDVFGNGMLLSPHIKLLAAFNHQHIFLDPNPNPQVSFIERQRLFNLPRSGWTDYDLSKISAGGGVYERSAKVIVLTDEVKQWLNVDMPHVTPNELIHLILTAKADLLYNGGIGTYVKSESESNEMVKDKANDQLRVNGNELSVRVLVEGGNLGVTQLGRIEFAKAGGAIYTDAIDNSAGVDCSDHEVNIKILFADIMQKTGMDIEKRNSILASMTDDVASLVLRDNELQTEVLQYAVARSPELIMLTSNYIDKLEKLGEIDRKVEFLPNHTEILERQRAEIGFTPPELAVLLAYSKMILDRQLLNSPLVNDKRFEGLLIGYFPKYLQENCLEFIKNHYLRKEIVANQLANLVVNRMGITFISRFEDEFRVKSEQIVNAFWVAYKLLDASKIFAQIEALDNKIDAEIQVDMLIRFKKALERLTRWILRRFKNGARVGIDELVTLYQEDMVKLLTMLPQILNANDYIGVAKLEDKFSDTKIPQELVNVITRSNNIPQLLDIAILAREAKHDLVAVAMNYFYIGRVLHMDWLRKNLIALPENNKWQALSRSALLSDGYMLYSSFVKHALQVAAASHDMEFAKLWISNYPDKVRQINDMFEELRSYKQLDLAMLSAIVRELSVILT
jgi:glutamate dehydrogenase